MRDDGSGTLSYNFRGQETSHVYPELELANTQIVDGLVEILDEIQVGTPVLTALCISGLYASQAYTQGAAARGIGLLNTLREINSRTPWINDAFPRDLANVGSALFMGLMMPLLANPEFAAGVRPDFLRGLYSP